MTKTYTANELMDLVRGFQAACILIAGAELDVFTNLRQAPADAEGMASRMNTDLRAMTVLLDALTALGLLEKKDSAYAMPPGIAEMLSEGGTRSLLGTVRHQGNCLRRWSQLAKVVLTGQPAQEISVRGEAEDTISFIRAMHEISSQVAPDLLRKIGPLKFSHLLDLGGASGTWTIPFLHLNPDAIATIFDLPEVIPMAEEMIKSSGLAGRIRLLAGDYNTDALPTGVDLAWISAIVHQNSREQNRAMFEKVYAALIPGGNVLIRDVVMGESRITPLMGALFAVNMLVGTPGGGTFTFNELAEDLASAGFVEARFLYKGEAMDSVVCATKPMD